MYFALYNIYIPSCRTAIFPPKLQKTKAERRKEKENISPTSLDATGCSSQIPHTMRTRIPSPTASLVLLALISRYWDIIILGEIYSRETNGVIWVFYIQSTLVPRISGKKEIVDLIVPCWHDPYHPKPVIVRCYRNWRFYVTPVLPPLPKYIQTS